MNRVGEGLRATLLCSTPAATGPAAMRAATAFYRHFQSLKELSELEFESAYGPRLSGTAVTAPTAGEDLRFTVSFLAPVGVTP